MNFDLNLLKVVVAVDQTGSVSGAADLLDMSQPGVSSALSRLRTMLGDKLFVRTGAGMKATPRAQSLLADARELLRRIQSNISHANQFDPAKGSHTFRLAMSDIGEMSILPSLLMDLKESAPMCTVDVQSLQVPQIKEALESGAIDLAIGYLPDLERAGYYQQQLFVHGFSCLLRREHHLKGEKLTRQEFESLGHVVVNTPVRSQDLVERYISKRGMQRRVALRIPHFLSLPIIVGTTDLVATVPTAVGTVFARSGLVRLVKPPFASPRFAVRQHWHRRFHNDLRNQWLRSRVSGLFNGVWRLPESFGSQPEG